MGRTHIFVSGQLGESGGDRRRGPGEGGANVIVSCLEDFYRTISSLPRLLPNSIHSRLIDDLHFPERELEPWPNDFTDRGLPSKPDQLRGSYRDVKNCSRGSLLLQKRTHTVRQAGNVQICKAWMHGSPPLDPDIHDLSCPRGPTK